MCPFILCGSFPTSEGYTLLAALSWATGERLLIAPCVNISYVFIASPAVWSPKVERAWWEIKTLVSDLPGSILSSPLRWELIFYLEFCLPLTYRKALCIWSSNLSLDMEREYWEFFFFSFDRVLAVRTIILLWNQNKSNLKVNMKHGFCYSRWCLPFLWGTETH